MLHHLDPRQASMGAAPDLRIYTTDNKRWFCAPFGTTSAAFTRTIPGQDTESAALHAARTAAGFGHVAERACNFYAPNQCTNLGPCDWSRHQDCTTCAWPRDAHV